MNMFPKSLTPFNELRELEERFHNIFSEMPSSVSSTVASFSPSVNTREGDYAYHVEVDLPGVKKKNINVEVKNNRLIISGERKSTKEVKEKDYFRSESSYGKFERSFSLPEDVDAENIKAACTDGVLEVILPKLTVDTKKKSKQIKVT